MIQDGLFGSAHRPFGALRSWALSLVVLAACTTGTEASDRADFATEASSPIVVQNGETQPIYSYAQGIRQSVFVEAAMDSDGDGAPDRIALDIVRPRTAAGAKVAVVMHASPYWRAGAAPERGLILPDARLGLNSWHNQYFVERGYAAVEVEMQGTARSQGCPMTGGREDTLSIAAAVDWLNGRARGFDSAGNPVTASWSTGSVGMVGVSYDGTLPIAVASQGIEGLKTIVPIAAISSWYDYTRDRGIAFNGWHQRYPQMLADYVVSSTARPRCAATLGRLGDDAGDDTFDYTSFWQERNYRTTADRIRASVFVVHGLSDWNVKPAQFSRLWYELARLGVPRKLWLHREGHVDPIGIRMAEWKRDLHHWMDHWLYGVENGVMSEPQVTIQRPNGVWETHASWPEAGTQPTRLYPRPSSVLSRTPPSQPLVETLTDDPSRYEGDLVAAPQQVKPYRLAYVGDAVTLPTRVSGTPVVHVSATFDTESSPLNAWLVDYGDATVQEPLDFSILELKSMSCSLADLQNRTGCAAPIARRSSRVTQRIVSRGSVDAKNRNSPSVSEPLRPGETYEVAVEMQPVEWVYETGHRIGLVLAANNANYAVADRLAGKVAVRLDATHLVLPISP